MSKLAYIAGWLMLGACLAMAADTPAAPAEVQSSGDQTYLATLNNGFSIRHLRREINGETTRLFIDQSNNFVDVRTTDIATIEAEPAPVVVKTAPVPERSLDQIVKDAGARHQIDPDFIASVIHAESGANPKAVSRKGAQGLMQLMPGTASQLGVPNSFDPEANVDGGTKYLRDLLERYNFDMVKALAAYNAGPQRVEQYGGVPPYYETRAYVARIVRDFNKKKIAKGQAMASTKTAQHKSAQAPSPATAKHTQKSSSGTTVAAGPRP